MQIAAEFVTSAAGAGDFPRDRLAEVAIVGRSNVGKSSLINALARRKIARTSAAPGKTRLANFYRVQRGTASPLYLVDLPGYGYARGQGRGPHPFGPSAPRRAERREARTGSSRASSRDDKLRVAPSRVEGHGAALPEPEFSRLTEAYFARAGSTPIGVLLLVDARHPGLDSDLDAWAWLQSQPWPRAVIGTKVDKLTRAERARHTRELESLFDTPVLLVSAQDGEGLEELWKLIVRLPNRTAA